MTKKFVIEKKGLKVTLIKGLNNILNQIKKQNAVRIGSSIIALTMIGTAATACNNTNGSSVPNETNMSAASTETNPTNADPTVVTPEETLVEVDDEVLKVNIDDYETMITPSFDKPESIDSYTIDNVDIIGNQYYADLSTDEFILTSPENVELVTKGEEYETSESGFTNALLEIGGQVNDCALDTANYATVDGFDNETFIVYDTKSNDSNAIDANSKILTTDRARVEYKAITEDDFMKIDSEYYYRGFISIGSKDIALDGAKIISNVEGTDDMLIAANTKEYGYCIFKTSKHNIVLELGDANALPEIEGTTIDFTGDAYINYKFLYDRDMLYHSISSVILTDDGMLYCYGEDSKKTKVLTIISSDLCNIEASASNANILPDQTEETFISRPTLDYDRDSYEYPKLIMDDCALKKIGEETYLCGTSSQTQAEELKKPSLTVGGNYSIYNLDSFASSISEVPFAISDLINPIHVIINTPSDSYSTTMLQSESGLTTVTKGMALLSVGNEEAYAVKVTKTNKDSETTYRYMIIKKDKVIVKGLNEDLQKILKKN